jgi:hypothetical protein
VVELGDRIIDTLATRLFLDGATPYIGNQWKIVSRAFCDFVCHDPSVERYKAFYRNTFIADEGFFQTVMMNTAAHGEVVNDDKRMIDWIPDGDIKLRPRTFTAADAVQLTPARTSSPASSTPRSTPKSSTSWKPICGPRTSPTATRRPPDPTGSWWGSRRQTWGGWASSAAPLTLICAPTDAAPAE